jgi:hypothetical protein
MMIRREYFTDKSTIGTLWINNAFVCYTLEDCDRKLEEGNAKIWGKTAIPRGTYEVTIDWSDKLGGLALHVLNVPGFSGVRIHRGNRPEQTDGCILPGLDWIDDEVIQSTAALKIITVQVFEAILRMEKVYLQVT